MEIKGNINCSTVSIQYIVIQKIKQPADYSTTFVCLVDDTFKDNCLVGRRRYEIKCYECF